VAPRVYTSTLVRKIGGSGTETIFTVPHGKRCVVTSVSSVNDVAVPAPVAVVVAGVYVLSHRHQVASETVSLSLRAVAYGGETVKAVHYASGIQTTVTGFLFDDPSGAAYNYEERTREVVVGVGELPAEL